MNPTDLSELLLIPKDRIGVLIGEQGKTKKFIEKKTKTKLSIDSKTNEIEISSKEENSEKFYKTISIVKAIARGFSPKNALKLLKEENFLEIIELIDFTGKSTKAMNSKKGRIIGRQGKTRETIEQNTKTKISIYGKTIAIIGDTESVEKAKQAITILLQGSSHDKMENYLIKQERFEKRFEL